MTFEEQLTQGISDVKALVERNNEYIKSLHKQIAKQEETIRELRLKVERLEFGTKHPNIGELLGVPKRWK